MAAVLIATLLVCCTGSASAGPVYLDQSRPVSDRVEDLLGQMTLAEKVGQMDQIVVEKPPKAAASEAKR